MLLKRRFLEKHFSSQQVSVEIIGDNAVVIIDTEASENKRYGSTWKLSKKKSICEEVYLENGEREILNADKAPIKHLRIINAIAEKHKLKKPRRKVVE